MAFSPFFLDASIGNLGGTFQIDLIVSTIRVFKDQIHFLTHRCNESYRSLNLNLWPTKATALVNTARFFFKVTFPHFPQVNVTDTVGDPGH